jgi:hypothetical protein
MAMVALWFPACVQSHSILIVAHGGLAVSVPHPVVGARSSRAAHVLRPRAARESARAPCVMTVDLEGAAAAGVAIRPSPGKGLGAFTLRARSAGELVGDYVGEAMSAREKDARYLGVGERTTTDLDWISSRRDRGVSISGDYILGVGNDIYIDAVRPRLVLRAFPRGRPREGVEQA